MGQHFSGPVVAVSLCILLSVAACASAPAPVPPPDPTAEKEKEKKKAPLPWAPPVPKDDGHDWVMLKSGEWLKGEINVFREDTLEFDSKELDVLQLDWKDVALVRSPRKNSLLFLGRRTAVGTVLIQKDKVVVRTAEGEKRYDRADLLTVIPGELSESNFWSGKLSLGFTGRAGNTDQTDLSAYLFFRRQTLSNRLEASYTGNLSEVRSVQTVNNHRISAKFDVFIGDKWFITVPNLEIYRDIFKNIGLQVTPSVLAGYHVIHEPKMRWDVQLGAGYRYTEYESVEEGAPKDDSLVNLIGQTSFEWDITSNIELKFLYWIAIGVPETADTNQHAEIRFSIDLIKDFDLDIAWVWDRVGNPAADADGNVPLKDDYTLTFGIGWEF